MVGAYRSVEEMLAVQRAYREGAKMDRLDDIAETIVNVIKEQTGIENVSPTSDFVADLGLDSLDMVELVMAIEDKFGIGEIPDEDWYKDHSVKGLTLRTPLAFGEYILQRQDSAATA